jgi:hypothetical protein
VCVGCEQRGVRSRGNELAGLGTHLPRQHTQARPHCPVQRHSHTPADTASSTRSCSSTSPSLMYCYVLQGVYALQRPAVVVTWLGEFGRATYWSRAFVMMFRLPSSSNEYYCVGDSLSSVLVHPLFEICRCWVQWIAAHRVDWLSQYCLGYYNLSQGFVAQCSLLCVCLPLLPLSCEQVRNSGEPDSEALARD